MRVVVAPDKFKGTFSAAEAASAIARGVRHALPEAEIIEAPVGDGGDGTLDALCTAGWVRHDTETVSAQGQQIRAAWASKAGKAYIELAAASGWQGSHPTPIAAARASTYGTGLLVLAALDAGFEDLYIGLGGSATTDGGLGLLRALGAKAAGHGGSSLLHGGGALKELVAADLRHLDPRLTRARITAVCDVRVPLLGPRGAAHLFAPQKGADESLVEDLELGLDRLATVIGDMTGRDARGIDWAGAAGGTGGGLHAALDAGVVDGAAFVCEAIGLTGLVRKADMVIVGEGSMDVQSLAGKAPIGVARIATTFDVPVVAIVGRLAVSATELQARGINYAVEAALGRREMATTDDLAKATAQLLVRLPPSHRPQLLTPRAHHHIVKESDPA